MKTFSIPLLALALTGAGCTTVTLEQYTLSQIHTGKDCRDEAVLDCLASVAANPDTLPSFSLFANGLTYVQDMATVSSTTSWLRSVGSFGMETLGLTISRSPHGEWTVGTVVEYQQLEALHAACLWALYGPERANHAYPGILGDPLQNPHPDEPRFGVEERLSRIPLGWVHCGRLKDVPLCARYKARCGTTWVWVMSEDTEAFAQFTLVLHDIATRDPNSLTVPQFVVWLSRDDVTQIKDLVDTGKQAPVSTTEMRAVVNPHYRKIIEAAIREAMQTNGKVNLSWAQWMAYTVPYHGARATITPAAAISPRSPAAQAILTPTGRPASGIPPGSPPEGLRWDLKRSE